MIKLLHTADWHLCSPLQGHSPDQAALLRKELMAIPGKVAALCRQEGCDLLLLAGDVFDGPTTADGVAAVKTALRDVGVPVFISPGNHDFVSATSPWLTEVWPENVHIFCRPTVESVYVESLGCHVYGAGYTSIDCPALLQGFQAPENQLAIGVFHGDPTVVTSPYCPITRSQVEGSGLNYLALGHIHKGGQFRAGNTLCVWPGCAMGRGYDEEGEKGVVIATLDAQAEARFVSLDTPRFFDLECIPETLEELLPPVGSGDFYRVTLTGERLPLDLDALRDRLRRFPNLILRDRTVQPVDVWKSVGEDSFEGALFGLLQDAIAGQDPAQQARTQLAAKLCRQLLDGQEVVLP